MFNKDGNMIHYSTTLSLQAHEGFYYKDVIVFVYHHQIFLQYLCPRHHQRKALVQDYIRNDRIILTKTLGEILCQLESMGMYFCARCDLLTRATPNLG